MWPQQAVVRNINASILFPMPTEWNIFEDNLLYRCKITKENTMSQNTPQQKAPLIKTDRRDSRVNHCISLLGKDDVNPTPCDTVMNNTVERERERERKGEKGGNANTVKV